MSSVVVGGSGFIGSRLALALAVEDGDVLVLDAAPPPDDVAGTCAFRVCDVSRADAFAGAFADADVVYLAAALLAKQCDEAPDRCWAVNVAGTKHALTELVTNRLRPRVVFLSTGNVYGDAAVYPVAEDAATPAESLYARTKLAGERAVASAAAAGGFTAAVLRLFTVYGPGPAEGRRGHFVAGWIERSCRGEPLTVFGDGRQTVDLTHVADVVQACRLAASAPIRAGDCRVYNIGSGVETPVSAIASWLREVVPSLEVERMPPKWRAPARQFADVARARAELGYRSQAAPETGVKSLLRDALASRLGAEV